MSFKTEKKNAVSLVYINGLDERDISTKARPIQMNQELMQYYKKEINKLLEKQGIRLSKSPCSCVTPRPFMW
jgi:hypothetical protein